MRKSSEMVIVASLLLLSVSVICCSGQEVSVVLVDTRGASDNISFAGEGELNYTEHLKLEVKPISLECLHIQCLYYIF